MKITPEDRALLAMKRHVEAQYQEYLAKQRELEQKSKQGRRVKTRG